MKSISILIAAALLSACASTTNIPAVNSAEAQRTVFAAGEVYKGVLTKMVEYESKPRCTAQLTVKCSKPDIVAQMRKADNVASAALEAAQAAVRSPDIGGDAQSKSIQTANAALAALSALLSLIGNQP